MREHHEGLARTGEEKLLAVPTKATKPLIFCVLCVCFRDCQRDRVCERGRCEPSLPLSCAVIRRGGGDFVNVYRALLDVLHMYSVFLSFDACLALIQRAKLAA